MITAKTQVRQQHAATQRSSLSYYWSATEKEGAMICDCTQRQATAVRRQQPAKQSPKCPKPITLQPYSSGAPACSARPLSLCPCRGCRSCPCHPGPQTRGGPGSPAGFDETAVAAAAAVAVLVSSTLHSRVLFPNQTGEGRSGGSTSSSSIAYILGVGEELCTSTWHARTQAPCLCH
jgi:hypothetical protein